jgi:alpha-L-rhamnosidase
MMMKRAGMAALMLGGICACGARPMAEEANALLPRVETMRCEYLNNPMSVNTATPRLSWMIRSAAQDVMQSGYQMVVASSPEKLGQDQGDLWDSGRVASDQSLNVAYAGKALSSRARCFWKVRMWDNAGRQSPWSAPASFSVGLLQNSEWSAHWIAFPHDDSNKTPEPAPQLRTEFTLDPVHGKISHATLFITGLGAYNCLINGLAVSNDVLSPGWTDYNKTVLYNTFDVTKWLMPGANAIGITLGNGPYNVLQTKGRYTKFAGSFGIPKALAQLEITFADGFRTTLTTDHSWKAIRGPITFNHQYGGEDYDARRETPRWTDAHFDDRAWLPAEEVPAPGFADHPAQLVSPSNPPDKVCHSFSPQKITQPKPGVYIYDLGQNMSGWPRIKVKGPAGATIKLTPGELLDKNGLVTQRQSGAPVWFSYTLKGGDEEEWQPRFSYYGFRYVQVTGAIPANPEFATSANAQHPLLEELTGQFVHADLPAAGTFSSSSDTLNRIHSLIDYAVLSNVQSVLTDCPHREKLGWLEESHLMGQAIMMNWEVVGLYEKIERDMAEAQTADGLVPDIAPEFTTFSGGFRDSPEWGSAAVIDPWYAYQFYGDKQLLADHYDAMKNYVAYLGSKAKDHLLDFGLGDWYDIGPKPPGVAQLTSKSLSATAVYYQDIVILRQTATLLGKTDDAVMFTDLAAAVKQAFNAKFFDAATAQYEQGSQTANAMPLVVGLVPEEKRAAVSENLVAAVRNNHNRVTAGDVGFSYVVRALTDANHGDVLFDLTTQTSGPGYVDQLNKGATTLTEAWDAGASSSQNHFMLGHVEAWFYRGLGGIQADPASPAFKHFFIAPEFPPGVDRVAVSHDSPYGRIGSQWQRGNGKITVTLDIPPNTSATVTLPTVPPKQERGSGHYTFTFVLPV